MNSRHIDAEKKLCNGHEQQIDKRLQDRSLLAELDFYGRARFVCMC